MKNCFKSNGKIPAISVSTHGVKRAWQISTIYYCVCVAQTQDDTLNGCSAAQHRPPWTRVTIFEYQNIKIDLCLKHETYREKIFK